MRVCKFGGTSVGSAQRLREVADIIQKNQKAIIVLSAMSGTTNALVKVAEFMKREETYIATGLIQVLKSKYLFESNELLADFNCANFLDEWIEDFFNHIIQLAKQDYSLEIEKELLVQGEFVTTHIFTTYLDMMGLKVENISALQFMRTDRNAEPDQYYIAENLIEILDQYPDTRFFITQGYVCKNVQGKIDNLGRGGSDYSATIIGAAIDAEDVQIWTDIDGMHNNDPRYVESTQSIEQLSYSEAEELAYFGAKILHPTCILPVRQHQIPIFIKNTMAPDAIGTRIGNDQIEGGAKAVAAKDGIIAIKIKSARMLMAYGFLRRVFEIFEDYKTPIDMVTTSEVAVSMTIDNDQYLNEIVSKLKKLGEVTVTMNQSIICVVGNFHADTKGMIGLVGTGLKNIPIRMISFGASNSNITLLIDTNNKSEALNYLSESLFKTAVYV
ncbi:MAG: aspartate kinase [Bacteroidetes bacterium]|nr:aspartate kinase [Bacteroidota bacterium]